MGLHVTQLGHGDLALMRQLNAMFGEVFADADSYAKHPPSDEYLNNLLVQDTFIALACIVDGMVIGGLAAYELTKFEQERSEIYIYDLAVRESHQRKGVATALVRKLQDIVRVRGAYVIFVQADKPDDGAIAFYRSLTDHQEDVFHFDIRV
jgi:aminoglycoside 3-N-acetyltransferase I